MLPILAATSTGPDPTLVAVGGFTVAVVAALFGWLGQRGSARQTADAARYGSLLTGYDSFLDDVKAELTDVRDQLKKCRDSEAEVRAALANCQSEIASLRAELHRPSTT